MSTGAALAVALAAALVGVGLITHFRGLGWTGFADKTLWDWLQLMIVPLVLAALAFALNSFQDERDRRREDDRAELQRSITLDERREETLQTYLHDMSELLLQRRSGPSHLPPRVLVVARTLTLSTLRRLDGIRKGVVVQFLSESELIKSWPGSDPYGSNPNRVGSPVIDLSDADLRGVVMNDAVLVDGAAFRGTDMRHAQFRNAFLIRPDFMGADLRDADFTRATINTSFTVSEPGACLSGARFVGTSLLGMTIWGAGYDVDFSRARLSQVRLKAHLTNVTLDGATFTNTKVPKAWRTRSGTSSRSEIEKECALIRYEERKGAQ